jgi:2-dehydro-3-deoxygluconokinase
MDIFDRVGSGGSFMGGLIYGLSANPSDHLKTFNFASDDSALKHTIFGNFNLVSINDVEMQMEGDGSGRVGR